MAEAIIFPDVIKALASLLRTALAVPVGTNVPNPRPTAFVLLRRVGGQRRSLVVDQPTVAVEAWHANEVAATALAQLARAHIHAAVGTSLPAVGTVYRVDEFAGPASLPDPDSDQARVTFTVSIAVRGSAA